MNRNRNINININININVNINKNRNRNRYINCNRLVRTEIVTMRVISNSNSS